MLLFAALAAAETSGAADARASDPVTRTAATASSVQGDGIRRGAVVLPPLTPGTYSLHLEVTDTPAGAETTFDVDLEVLQRPGR